MRRKCHYQCMTVLVPYPAFRQRTRRKRRIRVFGETMEVSGLSRGYVPDPCSGHSVSDHFCIYCGKYFSFPLHSKSIRGLCTMVPFQCVRDEYPVSRVAMTTTGVRVGRRGV
jgi:hypothetical protein